MNTYQKPIKFLLALLLCQCFATPAYAVILDDEPEAPKVVAKPKHKAKAKPPKMTEITQECIVDKATGREFCQVVDVSAVPAESAIAPRENAQADDTADKTDNRPTITNFLD